MKYLGAWEDEKMDSCNRYYNKKIVNLFKKTFKTIIGFIKFILNIFY